jgi:hypothetical protein
MRSRRDLNRSNPPAPWWRSRAEVAQSSAVPSPSRANAARCAGAATAAYADGRAPVTSTGTAIPRGGRVTGRPRAENDAVSHAVPFITATSRCTPGNRATRQANPAGSFRSVHASIGAGRARAAAAGAAAAEDRAGLLAASACGPAVHATTATSRQPPRAVRVALTCPASRRAPRRASRNCRPTPHHQQRGAGLL